MFDITIDVLGLDVSTPTQTELDNGELPAVTARVAASINLPFQVKGELVKVPVAMINMPLDKNSALVFSELLKEEAEKLPDPPKSALLPTAVSMQDVEREAKILEQFRKDHNLGNAS